MGSQIQFGHRRSVLVIWIAIDIVATHFESIRQASQFRFTSGAQGMLSL